VVCPAYPSVQPPPNGRWTKVGAVRRWGYFTNMCSHDEICTGRKLDDLEEEICQLASHIHAATSRWLRLLAEFDRREGWAPWGCRSCAHWVSWRCGIAPAAAREHVRVARRLEALPLIAAAFGEGRLSYSKVRALTRVGEIAAEQELLDVARHATAAQLERLVRAYRGVRAVEARARGERAERWVTWSYDDDGSLSLHARLPGEEGAMLVAAIEAAVERLRADGSGEAPTGGRHNEPAKPADGRQADVSAEAPTGGRHDDSAKLAEARQADVSAKARRVGAMMTLRKWRRLARLTFLRKRRPPVTMMRPRDRRRVALPTLPRMRRRPAASTIPGKRLRPDPPRTFPRSRLA
jgi:hypothetical protein